MPEKIINYIPADKFFELFEYKKVDVQKVIPGFVPGGGVMLMSPAFQSTPTTITTNEQENKSVTYFDQVQFKSTEPPSPPPSLTQSVAANNVCTIKLGSFDSTNFQHTNKNFVTTKCLNSNQGSERTEEEGVKDNDDVTDAIDLLESIEADSDAACLNVSPIVSSFVSPSFDACLDAETDESLSDSGLDEDMYHEMRREDCRKTARSHWYKKEEPRLEKCY
ncbi:hypothetical protein CANMA_003387, partial [Candida margitis]|uniref:uncharacterized protein n=1 Tax=Candida margitis TaxID=1775924 RepID=UPI002227CBF4